MQRFLKTGLAAVLILSFVRIALGDTDTALGDRSGEGSTPFTGVTTAVNTNLFTGAATTSIPIDIPRGRNAMTPKLALAYSSAGGPSPFGYGWDLPLGRIERNTRFGIPRCSPAHDDFVLAMPAGTIELVADANGTDYRPRFQEAYMLAQKFSTDGDNYWKVYDRSGMTYVFGKTIAARAWTGSDVLMQAVGAQCHYTGTWALTQIVDPNGNEINITYVKVDNVITPWRIFYGGHPGGDGVTAIPNVYRIDLTYQDIPEVDRSSERYIAGIPTRQSTRLQKIDVNQLTGGAALVRTYSFAYDQQPGGPAGPKTFLNAVTLTGYPQETFAYAPGATGFSTITYTPPAGLNRLRVRNEQKNVDQTILDMNGDGFVDIVHAPDGGTPWQVYPGGPTGFATQAVSWAAPVTDGRIRHTDPCGGGARCTTRDTLDMNGDGIPDYVFAGDTPIFSALCPAGWTGWQVHEGHAFNTAGVGGTFNPEGLAPLNLWCSPTEHARKEEHYDDSDTLSVWQDLVDMNADGRPDMVVAGGTPWQVYLNTGDGFSESPISWAAPVDSLQDTWIFDDPNPEGQTATAEAVLHMLADFNGDGLPDILKDDYSQAPDTACGGNVECMEVYFNTGQGFAASAHLVTIPTSRGLQYSSGVIGLDYSHTSHDIIDINGDGLPDWVHATTEDGWRVMLNIGGDFEPLDFTGLPRPPRVWTGAQGFLVRRQVFEDNPDLAVTDQDMFDFNGDGLLDHVDYNDGNGTWAVHLNATATRPHLLTGMQRLGGTTTLRYAPSSTCVGFPFGGLVPCDHTGSNDDLPDLPFVTWVLVGLRENDGQCTPTGPGGSQFNGDVFSSNENDCIGKGNERITLYAHRHGSFDSETREFRGFGFVDTKTLDLNMTRTEFLQDAESKGRTKETIHYAFLNLKPVLVETNTWSTAPLGSGRTKVWLASNKKQTRDLEETEANYHVHIRENITVDAYGNVLETRTTGAGGTDSVSTETQYAIPAAEGAGAIYDKPMHTRSLKDAAVFAEQWFYYDGGDMEADGLPEGQIAKGNVRMVKARLGDSDLGYPRTRMTYDDYGNIIAVKDARGNEVTTQYDAYALHPAIEANALGHAVTTVMNYSFGKPAKVIGPNGSTTAGEHTTYAYDTGGRVECVRRPGAVQPCSTRYTYTYATAPGQLTQITVEQEEPNRGSGYLPMTEFLDGLGRHRKTHAHRRVGGASGADQTVVVGQVDYDSTGRLWKQYQPYVFSGTPPDTTALESMPKSVNSYLLNGGTLTDPLSRVAKVTAANGTIQRTHYFGRSRTRFNQQNVETREQIDPYGRVRREEIWTNSSTFYSSRDFTYDGADRLRTLELNDNAATTITNTYDLLGRKTQTVDPDSGTWTYEYDAVGNLKVVEDPKTGQHVQQCFDALNRMTFRTPMTNGDWVGTYVACTPGAGTGQVRYRYDQPDSGDPFVENALGQLTKVDDETGFTRFEEYDERGRLEQVTRQIEEGTPTHATMRYQYDTADRITVTHYPDGERVQTLYDSTGQPKRLRSISHNADYISDVSYDRFGRWTELKHANSVDDLRTFYDQTTVPTTLDYQQPETLRVKRTGANPYLDLTYTAFTTRGFVGTVTDNRHTSGVLSNRATYQYDLLGRLTTVVNAGTSVETPYRYDEYGNVTQKGTRTFTYNYNLKPHQATQVTIGGTNHDILHDANGNRWLKYETLQGYTYDAQNRLTAINEIGASTSVKYDYTGRRVVKQTNAETIRYYNDLVETVDPSSGSDYQVKYYFLGSMRVASRQTTFLNWQAFLDSGAVRVASVSLEEPALLLLVRGNVQAAVALSTSIVVAGLLFAPWRRRRVVGIAVRHGHVILVILAVTLGTLPWPLVVRPAAAADPCGGPTSTPTQTPLPTITPTPPPVGYKLVHYHHDHLGSTQVITDTSGTAIEQIRYQPYGDLRGRWDDAATPQALSSSDQHYTFTTYESEYAGLYYAGARFYDPQFGTFLTHDQAAQFASPYTYTSWNPVNLSDPSGNFVETAIAVGWFVLDNLGWVLAVAGAAAVAIDTGIQTGNAGTAIEAGLLSFTAGLGTGQLLGPTVGVAFGKLPTIAQVSVLLSAGGYATYQFADNGYYATAAVAGFGALLSAYKVAGFGFGAAPLPSASGADEDFIAEHFSRIPDPKEVLAADVAAVGENVQVAGLEMQMPAWWKDLDPETKQFIVDMSLPGPAMGRGAAGAGRAAWAGLKGKQATAAAKALGYTKRIPAHKMPFNTEGQAAFQKGQRYITADKYGHKGGVWKMFDSQGRRLGTYDKDLIRIGD